VVVAHYQKKKRRSIKLLD